MNVFKLSIFSLCLIIFSNECLSAPATLCSKFSYDEQLLERMIRTEFNVKNMEKNMLATEKNIQETQRNIIENQKNVTDTSLKAMEDKVKQLEEKDATFIDNINKALADIHDNRVVAFHAKVVADKSLTNNQVIVFTKVTMNVGNGYDHTNGYFTAPDSGIYHFTTHLCGRTEPRVEYVFVVNNIKWASGLYKANILGACTSFSVTVQMKSGERAWVTIDAAGSSSTTVLFEDSDDWNYFTGFLIRRMDKTR